MSGPFARLLLLQATATLALYALRPMVSYRALELGASPAELGVVAAAFAFLALFLAVPMGRWIDRVGATRFILAGTLVFAVCATALSAVATIPALVAAQALLGLGHTLVIISAQTITANAGPPEGRDARFGAFTVAASLGQMLGPAAGGFFYVASGESLDRVFLACAGVTLIAAACALSLLLRPPRYPEESAATAPVPSALLASVGTVLRRPSIPHAMAASLTVATTIDLLAAYLPAYGEQRGIAVETVGLLLSATAVAGIASRLLLVPLLRRLGRRRLLMASLLLPALAFATLSTTGSPALLAVLLLSGGFGLGLGQPLTMAWVASGVPQDLRGTALGVRLTGNRVGQVMVPMGVGLVGSALGVGAVFVATGALLATSATLVARSRIDSPTQPEAGGG